MIDLLIVLILAVLFSGIVFKLVHDYKNNCGPSCSGCPLVKQCQKDTLKRDFETLRHK